MHKRTLRELAKFASGLIAADLLVGIWLSAKHMLPINFFGISFNAHNTAWWVAFDILILILLVHYAWQYEERPRSSGERGFHQLVGTIFALVAILHLSRLIFGWQFILGSWSAPYWLNSLGAVIAGFLSYLSFHLTKRS